MRVREKGAQDLQNRGLQTSRIDGLKGFPEANIPKRIQSCIIHQVTAEVCGQQGQKEFMK